ncbi:MAG: HAD-IA family hydrolase [Sporichthyaceae bacterium]
MAGAWASFDCYGTLVDWLGGMRVGLQTVAPHDVDRLLAAYHRVEPRVQAEHPGMRYRDVLAEALRRTAEQQGVALVEPGAAVFADTLPHWPVFADVGPALAELTEAGWRLAILSNVDDDLIAGTCRSLPAEFDLIVTAQQVGSYKPDPAHFHRFRELAEPESWVHVAQSVFHDHLTAGSLGIPRVWINRRNEPDPGDAAEIELPGLVGLAAAVARLT